MAEKKHFMCTHTWQSDEAKSTAMSVSITDKEFFSMYKTDKAECLQHWMGDSEFFFCHWFAESGDAIHEALELAGDNDLILTVPYETPRYISSNTITDEPLVNLAT